MRLRCLGVLLILASFCAAADDPAIKRLNNLTWELFNLSAVAPDTVVAFTNPRDGWVYASMEAEVSEGGYLELVHEGDGVVVVPRDSVEGMRWLAKGEHKLLVRGEGLPATVNIVVRAVPELQYSRVPGDPYVSAYGPYDWAFLKAHILPHVNTILGEADNEHVDEWIARGGKWVAYSHVPQDKDLTADKAYHFWADNPGIQDPRFAGVIADEFQGRQHPLYPVWMEALRKLGETPVFDDDAFYAYCGGPGMYSRPQTRELVGTIFGIHSYMAWERYLHEMPTLEQAQAFLDSHLGDEMKKWREAFPGCERGLVMVAPIFTSGLSMNLQPQVDYKAWLDMQIRYYATDPAFDGLFGLQYWTADFADEELLRWAYRLFRHYGIEGRTDSLAETCGYTYMLDHITNPDFDQSLDGWQVAGVEMGSVNWGYIERLANLEGRYWHRTQTPDEPAGNTFLLFRRSATRPNSISQTVRNLVPGKLYSAKMISADHGDIVQGISAEKQLAFSIHLDGVEVIPEKSFQTLVNSRAASGAGEPFTGGKVAWFNHHRVVFRAKADTALLTISDWLTDDVPGGDPGQEILCNFIEVQPYFEK